MEDFCQVVGIPDTRESPCTKPADDDVVCVWPITPSTAEDRGGAVSLDFSPLMLPENDTYVARSSPSGEDANGGLGSVCKGYGSSHTPEGSVFNPFSAGECDAPRASSLKKLLDELNGCVTGGLKFGLPVIDIKDDGTQATDEEIVDSVYRNLLEANVMQQSEEILAYIGRSRMDLSSCLTATLFPLLNGIADTCPAAPIKRPPKSRVIEWGLRRKLDF